MTVTSATTTTTTTTTKGNEWCDHRPLGFVIIAQLGDLLRQRKTKNV